MQWLLHGTLTPAVADALKRREDRVHTVEELELPADAGLVDILKAAEKRQWDILTNDAAMAQAPFDAGLALNRIIVYLQLAGDDVEQDDAVDRLFERYRRLTPRRMYTVTEKRVKIRQLPGSI